MHKRQCIVFFSMLEEFFPHLVPIPSCHWTFFLNSSLLLKVPCTYKHGYVWCGIEVSFCLSKVPTKMVLKGVTCIFRMVDCHSQWELVSKHSVTGPSFGIHNIAICEMHENTFNWDIIGFFFGNERICEAVLPKIIWQISKTSYDLPILLTPPGRLVSREKLALSVSTIHRYTLNGDGRSCTVIYFIQPNIV